MHYLSAAWTGVYYIVYPISYILLLILHLLSIITAPLLYLGHYLAYACCWYPIHVLAKFETLYIFFGVAVLVGVLTGTSLHYASAFFISLLDLESRHDERRGRSLSSSRAGRQNLSEIEPPLKVKQKGILPISDDSLKGRFAGWERSSKDHGSNKKGLVPNTILEEGDSTGDGF